MQKYAQFWIQLITLPHKSFDIKLKMQSVCSLEKIREVGTVEKQSLFDEQPRVKANKQILPIHTGSLLLAVGPQKASYLPERRIFIQLAQLSGFLRVNVHSTSGHQPRAGLNGSVAMALVGQRSNSQMAD